MLLKVVVVFAYLVVLGKSAERGKECVDQSGEKGVCTSIQSCRISIKSFNSSTVGNKIEISMSVCGYDNEPLVCCQPVSSATEKSANSVSTASPASLSNNSETLVSITTTVSLSSNSETVTSNKTKQTRPIESSTTSNNLNAEADEENNFDKPLFTSPPLIQPSTTTTEINNVSSVNLIESNNLPDVLPLQSNNTTSASQFTPTFVTQSTPTFSPFTQTTTPLEFIERFTIEENNPTSTIQPPLSPATPPISTFPLFIPTTTTLVELPPISKFMETTTSRKQLPSKTINKLLPDIYTCGFQNPSERSENAPITTIDEFPWTVLLNYRYGYGFTYNFAAGFRCMGTLISNRYVITAAECITNNLFYAASVRLGEWLIPSVNDCVYDADECADKVVDVGIEKIIPHPDYDPSCGLHDIALIRLNKDINYSVFIRPICLPIEDLPEPSVGTILTTSGWGVTENGYQLDIKSKIKLPVVWNNKCVNQYRNFKKLLENQFCVGTTTSNNICLTDSGGPLMAASREDKWYLEGIIPEGFGCDQRCNPGMYIRVTKYVGWILDTISKDTL